MTQFEPGDNPQVNSRAVDAEHRIGAVMTDGTIYAGISPDTGSKMYAIPIDAPLTTMFNEAADYAARLDAHGHQDWRIPTKRELNALFKNRVAVGGLKISGPESEYWSALQNGIRSAWTRCFRTGSQRYLAKDCHASLRLVR
jgi:hypothetical protein